MFRQKRKPSDFGREIEAHLQLETERLREEGLIEAEARAAVRRAFGNVTEAEERLYKSGRWLFWDHLRQDSRMATVALGVLGAILSVTGIFGISTYSVSKRLRELGIRVALGAQWKEVLGAALGRAIKVLGFGSAAG